MIFLFCNMGKLKAQTKILQLSKGFIKHFVILLFLWVTLTLRMEIKTNFAFYCYRRGIMRFEIVLITVNTGVSKFVADHDSLLKYGSQDIIPFWCKCSIFLSLFLCLKNEGVAKNVNLNINL